MLSRKSIVVPNYQRAYSWDTDPTDKSQKQVNTFLSDLEEYVKSQSSTPYYLGHFLFKKNGKNSYDVIDGQQRLTTIIIFISALCRRLKEMERIEDIDDLSYLDEDLFSFYEDSIKSEFNYMFSTVEYDNQMFRDYVIDQRIHNRNGMETISQERIADAFDYFCNKLTEKTEDELLQLSDAIIQASCTSRVVTDECEAVQIFMFQNNRGKKPTNMEIIKAQFMYHIHLYAPVGDKQHILNEITERFEHIYKSIAKIEGNIDEDDVLNYTIKVYRNSLEDVSSTGFIDEELDKADNCISFIREFTLQLASCFRQISSFMDEEKTNFTYHELFKSAYLGIMFPFVIKAMLKGMPQEDMNELAKALEQIFLRHYIIGTRASLESRLNECFQEMDNSATPVVYHIQGMKTRNDWYGYWNNDELLRTLNMWMYHGVAKLLLWKYENYLIQSGKAGYKPLRYDDIEEPNLEHIAPQKENTEENNGYCTYDEEFKNQYLECLGNYLLLSGSHNKSLSNGRFQIKRDSYTHLQQQIEVRDMTEQDKKWDKEKINTRHKKIVEFLMSAL